MSADVVAGLPAIDVVLLTAMGFTVSGLVATAGWFVLRRWPGAQLRTQIAVVSLVGTIATVASVLIASDAMFVSRHDAAAVLVVAVAAGLTGVLAGGALARRVARSSAALGKASSSIGDQGFTVPPVATAELGELARRLETTSARLAQAHEREQALERSRRELVAWVSHDLRTPLAGIRAMVEALEDGVVADPEAVASYYRSLRRETDRLRRLVDDLFEMSRIDAGTVRLARESVSLGDLASDAMASARSAAVAKGVHVAGRMLSAAVVVGSTAEIGRVITNLIDNAIRCTPPGGDIRVDIGADSSFGIVSVADACGGIPEADLGRIFEPGFRSDEARTPGPAGSGLGLAIARGLVEAQAGRIEVSNENGGCRFTVRLPRAG